MNNISPEEKLLRLIRGEKKAVSNIPPKDNTPNTAQGGNKPVLKPLIKNPLLPALGRGIRQANLKRILPALLTISIIYLLTCLVYPLVGLKKISLPVISQEKIKEPIPIPKDDSRPLEFYLQEAQKRPIFGGTTSLDQIPAVAVDAESIKDISLVGIITGDMPQAIIEDKKAQKSYSVAKGQFIGNFKIEEILEGKIILSNKGQRYDLTI